MKGIGSFLEGIERRFVKFIVLTIVAFSLSTSASAESSKPNHLDFNSYVRENYEILSHVRKPSKAQVAFEEEKERTPANTASAPQNVDYGVDKNGNGAAGSSKSIWGSMNGSQGPAVLPPQPAEAAPAAPAAPAATAATPAAPADSSSSSSSGANGGTLPQ
jgi:hypothetical protein